MKNSLQIDNLPLNAQNRLGLLVYKTVQKALQDESNRLDFEEWYFQTYGKKYVWKHKN